MNSGTSHIISAFKWKTTIDDRKHAPELQNRISTWSNTRMLGEIEDVLNTLCPSEQTWRIQSLELDFGEIDFENFEHDSAIKLRALLREQLVNLILRTPQGGKNLEVIDKATSNEDILVRFFLEGITPWSYSNSEGSVNQLLTDQLKHNQQQIIIRLRAAGMSHERVRRRMAWQMNELNMRQFIKGLEPTNHSQIEHFSQELITIQKNETIVQSNIADFGKNVWFWILNHLLAEKGTIFNQVSFMKSTIQQMANHYNIGYLELMDLIKRTIDKVRSKFHVDLDFLKILQLITNEGKGANNNTARIEENNEILWDRFSTLLAHSVSKKSVSETNELNQLIHGLSTINTKRFKGILTEVFRSKNDLQKALGGINESSFITIVSVMNPDSSKQLHETITFLHSLLQSSSIQIKRNALWQIALAFILNSQKGPFNTKECLIFFLTEISKHQHTGLGRILEEIIGVSIPSAAKNVRTLQIYSELNHVYNSTITMKNPSLQKRHFEMMIKEMDEELGLPVANKKRIEWLRNSLERYIKANPSHALKILRLYKDKRGLHAILSDILNDTLISLLVKNASEDISKTLLATRNVLIALCTDKQVGKLASAFSKDFMRLSLKAIVHHPKMDAFELVEQILKEFSSEHSNLSSKNINLFMLAFFEKKGINALGISEQRAKKLQKEVLRYAGIPTHEKLKILLASPSMQEQVASILTLHLAIGSYSKFFGFEKREQHELLNYLVTDGRKLMEDLVKEYTILLAKHSLKQSQKEIKVQLEQLYWTTIADYRTHHGKAEVLQLLFKDHVFAHYGVSKEPILASSLVLLQDSGIQISKEDLLTSIEKGFKQKTKSIQHDGANYSLDVIFQLGISADPVEVRKLLAKIPITQNRIDFLDTHFSFEEFSVQITNDLPGIVHDTLKIMRLLNKLSNSVGLTGISKKLQTDSWITLWKIITVKTWNESHVRTYVKQWLTEILKNAEVSSSLVLTEMKAINISLNADMLKLMNEFIPSIAELTQTDANTKAISLLQKCHQAGQLEEFSYALIHGNKIPNWLNDTGDLKVCDLLHELLAHYPIYFLNILKEKVIPESQITILSTEIPFEKLCLSIGSIHKSKQALLANISQLYSVLGHLSFTGVTSKEVQEVLFRKVLKAWSSSNWKILSPEAIWNELIWELYVKRGLPSKKFINDLEKSEIQFPPALQLSLDRLIEQSKPVPKVNPLPLDLNYVESESIKEKIKTMSKEGIAVKNAGLVLMNNYLTMLLDRLEITQNGKFVSDEEQHQAIHYLQYVVTGLSRTEESLLPLNKVLCGVPLSEPIADGIDISDQDKTLVDGLIKAAIGHWPAIGDSSINGFRGNWLVRDGLLIEDEDRWELTVEKRPYDVLINQSPFSFSIIRFPWMEKPLHITWPY